MPLLFIESYRFQFQLSSKTETVTQLNALGTQTFKLNIKLYLRSQM